MRSLDETVKEAQTPFFPSTDEYTIAQSCPTCHVQPFEPCNVKRPRNRRFHFARVDRGIWHYWKDVGEAPWRDERELGKQYGSLPQAPI